MKTAFVVILAVLGILLTCAEQTKKKKSFTYTINNQLEPPTFHESMEFDIRKGKPLIYYMEQSVLKDPVRFPRFTAQFLPSFKGYYIKAINGREAFWFVNQTYWQIRNADGLTKYGVSHYYPVPGDEILFNFTIGDPHASYTTKSP